MAKRKIIIVDDDRDTREMLTLAFELEGYEVAQAANGLRLISSLHVDQPDLIVLDVMMSWIDGFELCRSIKRNEQFKDIPVIFLSARKGADDQRRGFDSGASDYFTKPVQMDALLKRVQELIGGPGEGAPADRRGEAPEGQFGTPKDHA
ncbi:MAG: response regulator [Myxococcales bacterium]